MRRTLCVSDLRPLLILSLCDYSEFNERPAVHGSKMWVKYGGKSERTEELRSIMPRGFALAFKEANP